MNAFSWVIYFSDHGEVPHLQENSHPPGFFKSQFEIPFFIWYSEKYEKYYPQKIEDIYANRNKISSSDQLFHAICGIMDIEYHAYNEKLDFFHPLYT